MSAPAAAALPPAPPRRWPSKVRGWLRRTAILGCFAVGGAPWPHIAIPLALIASGGLLHFVAKGYLVRRARVTREGPYRWVRHPFYLANLLLEGGLLLFAGAWFLVPPYLLAALFAYRAAIREEEADLGAVHGETWREYAGRVPAILPFRSPSPRGDGPGFSFRNLLYEREVPRLMRLLSLPLGLAWWHAFRDQAGPLLEHELLPAPADAAATVNVNALLLIAFVGVHLASWFAAAWIRAPRLDGRPRFPERK